MICPKILNVDPRRGYVKATLTAPDQETHTIGYIRGEGWFCTTCAGPCLWISEVKSHVPNPDQQGD